MQKKAGTKKKEKPPGPAPRARGACVELSSTHALRARIAGARGLYLPEHIGSIPRGPKTRKDAKRARAHA